MSKLLNIRSFRMKLLFIIWIGSTATLILACGGFIFFEVAQFNKDLTRDMKILSSFIADKSTSAIMLNDPAIAEDALFSAAAVDTAILRAAVYDSGSNVVAAYMRNIPHHKDLDMPELHRNTSFIKGGSLHLFTDILMYSDRVGSVYIEADRHILYERLQRYGIITAGIIAVSLLFLVVISFVLQKLISKPIMALIASAKHVSEKKDYSVRVKKQSDDELGVLSDAFNEMLSQIQKRDSALLKSEKEHRELTENLPQRIFHKDDSLVYVSCNKHYAQDLGITPDEIAGKTDFNFYSKELAEKYRTDDQRLMESGHTEEIEEVYIKNGQEMFIQTVKTPLSDDAGNVTGILGIFWDITERKKAEEEMARLRSMLRNIIDSMPSSLVAVDKEGKVIEWNRMSTELTGISLEQARGKLLSDVFPQLNNEMDRVRKSILNRRVEHNPKVVSKVNNETRYEDVTIYPLVSNGVDGAVIRVDDVTERTRIEEMMIQTEKMLSVGGLAAGMAHEINNPLAGIMQNTHVITRRLTEDMPANRKAAEECGTDTGTIRAYMEKRGIPRMLDLVRESGSRAAGIVQNMLSFSRKSESAKTSEDLAELLDKTVELASSDYDLKKKYDFRLIEIVREYDQERPKVSCEASTIQQVFLNLLRNGAEAMYGQGDKAGFILRVKPEEGMVRVEIEDNGPGMDEATRKRVFEPFFTTKPVGLGTGLGLSVSYFIILEHHGGTMDVESSPGKGAKFIIRLPGEERNA